MILGFGMLQRAISMKLPFILKKWTPTSGGQAVAKAPAPPAVLKATVEKVAGLEQKANQENLKAQRQNLERSLFYFTSLVKKF